MLSASQKQARIGNNLLIAREGLPFIAIALVLCVILGLIDWFFPAVLVGLLTIFIVFFFRDPKREQDIPENAIMAPADGRVIKIEHLQDEQNPLARPCYKISIFMSVFNVHVNRNAVSGKATRIQYFPGKFLSANLEKASAHNERNQIIIDTNKGIKIAVVQIAGLIARRIVCWIDEGQDLLIGKRFGLIRFGSRLDIYVPNECRITAQHKQATRAGETIIGYLP